METNPFFISESIFILAFFLTQESSMKIPTRCYLVTFPPSIYWILGDSRSRPIEGKNDHNAP